MPYDRALRLTGLVMCLALAAVGCKLDQFPGVPGAADAGPSTAGSTAPGVPDAATGEPDPDDADGGVEPVLTPAVGRLVAR